MEKKFGIICGLLFLTTTSIFAQEKVYSWPVKGKDTGDGIIFKPQDYINGEHNISYLYIGAAMDSEIVSPLSGTVTFFAYGYQKTLNYIIHYKHNYNDSSDISGYDIKFRNEIAKNNNINPDYISLTLGLNTAKGEKYYISGLRPVKFFKTGTKINTGDVIGKMGYSYHAIFSPSISLSRSVFSKPADPMNIFGLKSTFITNRKTKQDYLTYRHPISKLLEDFEVFRNSLTEGHPGLYDYISINKLDTLFEQTKLKIDNPMTTEEFRILLLPIITSIRDSHTALQSKMHKVSDGSLPPILFGLKDDSLVVFASLPEYERFLKTNIISIDGESTSDIIPNVTKLIYGNDGYINSVKNRKLLLNFWKYYSQLTSKRNGNKVEIQFADGARQTFLYGNSSLDDYFPSFKQKKSDRFSISILSPKNALIDINTFNLLETDIDSIGGFIEQLSNSACQNLIIDVRDNYGGSSDVLAQIFSFIAKKPFRLVMHQKVNKKGEYELFRSSLNYSTQTNNVFSEYKSVNGKDGFYLTESHFPTIVPNDSIHFDDNIYILTNEHSLSAATVFAALTHKQKRGLIVGRETGSTYSHLNALKFAQIFLKNTKLELYIPLVKIVFDEKGESDIPWGRGVLPRHVVKIDFKDFLGDDDPILDALTKIIEESENLEVKNNNSLYVWVISILACFIIGIVLYNSRK